MFKNEENRPENCNYCVNYETCKTYYGSNICQTKWGKVEENKGKNNT